MADIRAVLERCDPSLLDHHDDQSDSAEAAMMVLHLTDSRQVQKVLWRQLFALDSLMSLLEGPDSAQQLVTQPCPPQPEGGARGRWKALKVESRSDTEETEALLKSLEEKVQEIHNKRHTLTQLLQQLHNKRQTCPQLEESVLTAQNALQWCDGQLRQWGAESEAALGQLVSWQRLTEQLQVNISAAQSFMHVHLLSLDKSQLSLELRPRPSADPSPDEPDPLRLLVSWSPDDRFTLQVGEGSEWVQQECGRGRWAELSAALLEVLQCYMGQSALLSEVRSLRSSFAIDWSPAERRLVYLKSSSLVCHLRVDEGYPGNGHAHLSAMLRDGSPVDSTTLKPHNPVPRLTDWLVFLCHCPLL